MPARRSKSKQVQLYKNENKAASDSVRRAAAVMKEAAIRKSQKK